MIDRPRRSARLLGRGSQGGEKVAVGYEVKQFRCFYHCEH